MNCALILRPFSIERKRPSMNEAKKKFHRQEEEWIFKNVREFSSARARYKWNNDNNSFDGDRWPAQARINSLCRVQCTRCDFYVCLSFSCTCETGRIWFIRERVAFYGRTPTTNKITIHCLGREHTYPRKRKPIQRPLLLFVWSNSDFRFYVRI